MKPPSDFQPYVIIFSIIIAMGFVLMRILQSVRQGAHKSGAIAGLGIAMMVLFGFFRNDTPQDKKKITHMVSKDDKEKI